MLTAKDLAKILNKNGGTLLDKIPLEQITLHLELNKAYMETNVKEDEEFQKKFIDFHHLSGAGINKEYLDRYFDIMEAHKKREGRFDFRLVARAVYGAKPKKKMTSPQFSYVTRMATVIDHMYPFYDGPIGDLYEFDRPVQTKYDSRERLNIYLDFYKTMMTHYEELADKENKMVYDLLKVFKIKLKMHGDYSVPDTKKIDFLVTSAAQLKSAGKLI